MLLCAHDVNYTSQLNEQASRILVCDESNSLGLSFVVRQSANENPHQIAHKESSCTSVFIIALLVQVCE